jgi:hypothetical protein
MVESSEYKRKCPAPELARKWVGMIVSRDDDDDVTFYFDDDLY